MSAAAADLLTAYRAGELDAAGAEALIAALRDPGEGPRLRALLRFEAGLVAVLAGEEDGHQRALCERLRASGESARFERRLRVRLPRRRSRQGRRVPASLPLVLLAALVLLAPLGWLLLREGERPVAAPAPVAVTAAAPAARLVAGTGVALAGRTLSAGDAIPFGARVTVADVGAARIACGDGSELELDAGCELTLGREGGLRVALERGRVAAAVAAQPAGDGFELRTAHARVSVLGTRFAVAVDDGASRVTVDEGRVAVAALAGDGQRELGAGEACSVDRHGAIRGPERRVELFAGGDTAAWQPLRGDWRVVDGVMTGSGDDEDRVRIASRASFRDLAVELRLRAPDAVAVELQLRGYRVFWTVPGERLADWATLRASAAGETFSASVDGQALPVEHSGSDVDPWHVAVYAHLASGGRLEIAEAVVTTTDPPAEDRP